MRHLPLFRRRQSAPAIRNWAAAIIGSFCLLPMPGGARADQPTPLGECALRLLIEVTPDVPNPSDPGFLSSLLGDHTGFQLFLLKMVDDTHVNVQLQGRGSADRCQAVVSAMRNDGRVESITVK